MTDETRETMYYASLKMHFAKPREVKRIVYDPVSLDEFIEIMLDKSPTAIYHELYSSKKAAYNIAQRVMRSDGGVYVYADAWADKTPQFKDWESFYKELLYQGMEYIKF